MDTVPELSASVGRVVVPHYNQGEIMDTSAFDDKITALTTQLADQQAKVDQHQLSVMLAEVKALGDDVQATKVAIADVESKKADAIALQAAIDESTQKIVDLKSAVSE